MKEIFYPGTKAPECDDVFKLASGSYARFLGGQWRASHADWASASKETRLAGFPSPQFRIQPQHRWTEVVSTITAVGDLAVDVYEREGTAVALVLWKAASSVPLLCLKPGDKPGNLIRWTLLSNDDVPVHDRRWILTNARVRLMEWVDTTVQGVEVYTAEQAAPLVQLGRALPKEARTIADLFHPFTVEMGQADDSGAPQVGLVINDCVITDPNFSECGRFSVDPRVAYGLEPQQVQLLKEFNQVLAYAVERGVDAAVGHVQSQLGIEAGDAAGHFFAAGAALEAVTKAFGDYLVMEVKSKTAFADQLIS